MTPPWLAWARREVGVQELVGPRHNPRVVEYWKLGRVGLAVSDDETPWCAAFVAAALEMSGFRSTRSGLARSYAQSKHLTPVPVLLGAICVLSSNRGPTSGHVGFIEAVDDKSVWLLGGNQSNSVNVAPFPRSRIVATTKPLLFGDLAPAPVRPPAGSVLGRVTDA